MAALWVARLLPLVAASRPSAGGVAAPPAEADSPAWRRLVEAWSRRRLVDAGDDACEHAECWSCPTASSCEAAGCFYEAEYRYCDTPCGATACWNCRERDACDAVDGCGYVEEPCGDGCVNAWCGETCSETACWSCRAADECDAAGDGCAWVGGDYPFCDTNHACEAASCFACGLDECAGVDGCMLDAPRGGPGAADYFHPSCTAFRECSGDYDCWACAEAECGAADGCEWLGDYCAEACGAGKCHVCGEDECEARGCDLVDASDLFAGADDDFRPKLCVESCSPTNCYFCLEDDCDATDGCMRHEGLCVEARECSPDHCWACGTGEACAAAGCAVVEDADGADLCVDPRCDDCESCGAGACQRPAAATIFERCRPGNR
jgi:hypothetical protein